MIYLLDTNACIAYLRSAHSRIRQRLTQLTPADVALCAVVKSELHYGALRSADPARSNAELAAFFAPYVSLTLDDRAAQIAGALRADLARRGTPIGPNDVLIAAIARAHDLTLVTHNMGEFSRVTGLQLEDWEVH